MPVQPQLPISHVQSWKAVLVVPATPLWPLLMLLGGVLTKMLSHRSSLWSTVDKGETFVELLLFQLSLRFRLVLRLFLAVQLHPWIPTGQLVRLELIRHLRDPTNAPGSWKPTWVRRASKSRATQVRFRAFIISITWSMIATWQRKEVEMTSSFSVSKATATTSPKLTESVPRITLKIIMTNI